MTWLSGDHQGTAMVAIDRDTQASTIRRQNPFGVARGTSVAWPNTRGFVGGTSDPTGLTHLGAREYDPGIGRFISVDPVQDLSDPQQWNGYTYANSSPVTFSDPSGQIHGSASCTGGMVGGPGACDGHEDPNFAGPSPESTGGYSSVTPGRSAGAGDSGGGARAEQQKHVDKAKARVVTAAKAILKIVMDIVGVTSALDCFTTGDLGSYIETGLNVLMSFVGGLGAKIVAKYAWRFKAAYRLGKQLKNLVTELVTAVSRS